MDAFDRYKALEGTTSTRDITSFPQNALILDQLRRNDPGFDVVSVNLGSDSEDNFEPSTGSDLEWLGYFIAKSTNLKWVSLIDYDEGNMENITREHLENFCKFVGRSKSIEKLSIGDFGHDPADNHFQLGMFLPMLKNLKLTTLEVYECSLGGQEAIFSTVKTLRSISIETIDMEDGAMADLFQALSTLPQLDSVTLLRVNVGRNSCIRLVQFLRESTNKLCHLRLNNNEIGNGGIEDLIHALRDCQKLKELIFLRNPMSVSGFQTLSTLFESQTSNLELVDLSQNQIDDERLELLTTALVRNTKLRKISLQSNPNITTNGWRTFSTLLESPRSSLEDLSLSGMNFADEEAILFAKALSGNKKLRVLDIGGLGDNTAMTDRGLAALSQLLSDSSSINNIYFSNHTLQSFGSYRITQYRGHIYDIAFYLSKNSCSNEKKKVATIKILYNRAHFNIQPLFEWDFKTLPFVVGWFEEAARVVLDTDMEMSNNNILGWLRLVQCRKLYVIYKFIRAMPAEYIELRIRRDSNKVQLKKRRLMQDLEDTEFQ